MPIRIVLNGTERHLDAASTTPTLTDVLLLLEMKADRVAVERNGEIVRRSLWPETYVTEGDKLEVVHFVGGGNQSLPASLRVAA